MLFKPTEEPRVYALPPGCSFPKEFVAGLKSRLCGRPPESMALTEVIVNTAHNEQAIREEFIAGHASFLPRLVQLTELRSSSRFPDVPAAVSPLRRRLELFQAVAKLIEADCRFGSRFSAFDLADTLAELMDEMHGEGVAPSALENLDISAQSEHWEASLRFLKIIERHWGPDAVPDFESRQRMIAEKMVSDWQENPPEHPVIIAGSTGSRGATQLLMNAIARLPQGAIVLPCFDFHLSDEVWTGMSDPSDSEAHPQYRFRQLMDRLDIKPNAILPWREGLVVNEPRNMLVSLALRPAPVTDQWLVEGPRLPELQIATRELTLLESPTPRLESVAIALKLRECAHAERTAALVTPDRNLARQVKAALGRWGIVPQDSAGQPISESSRGLFIRQAARILGDRVASNNLITLLKNHCANSAGDRALHCQWTENFELHLRREGIFAVDPDSAPLWALAQEDEEDLEDWCEWVAAIAESAESAGGGELGELRERHRRLAELVAAGPLREGTGILWEGDEGEIIRGAYAELEDASDSGCYLELEEYVRLLDSVLAKVNVWSNSCTHPGIMIWGTLEARMRRPDLLIAGRLNEGSWPMQMSSDPWLNRQMRKQAGLLIPERKIGLSAHDFQQVLCGPEVVLTRALRDENSPTVPSRWLSRLIQLLSGISVEGDVSIKAMRARGDSLLASARALELPQLKTDPAPRPSPIPPVESRPNMISVTAVETLILDPYAIYARQILKLGQLNSLAPLPDNMVRGMLQHKVFERLLGEGEPDLEDNEFGRLISIAAEEFGVGAPSKWVERSWFFRLASIAQEFLDQERERRKIAKPCAQETKLRHEFAELQFTLTGKADRVDIDGDGHMVLYDYKSGAIPRERDILNHAKQIPLLSKLLEIEGLPDRNPAPVKKAGYIEVGSKTREHIVDRGGAELAGEKDFFTDTWEKFQLLVANYRDPDTGYTSHLGRVKYADYDHLARFGEWDETSKPDQMQRVG
ncbi:MAG: double-strand break repair protein AddB [Albidovulum sp.]|nr:double-strand break repair protein AddB [Albidovulum sp.]